MKVLDVIRIKGRSGQLAAFEAVAGDVEPKTGIVLERAGTHLAIPKDAWVVMGVERRGSWPLRAGDPLGLLLSPDIMTIESGNPWIAKGDELFRMPKIAGHCPWCVAHYSTNEELQKHLEAQRFHIIERLAATEKRAEASAKKLSVLHRAASAVADLQPASLRHGEAESERWQQFYDAIYEASEP